MAGWPRTGRRLFLKYSREIFLTVFISARITVSRSDFIIFYYYRRGVYFDRPGEESTWTHRRTWANGRRGRVKWLRLSTNVCFTRKRWGEGRRGLKNYIICYNYRWKKKKKRNNNHRVSVEYCKIYRTKKKNRRYFQFIDWESARRRVICQIIDRFATRSNGETKVTKQRRIPLSYWKSSALSLRHNCC